VKKAGNHNTFQADPPPPLFQDKNPDKNTLAEKFSIVVSCSNILFLNNFFEVS